MSNHEMTPAQIREIEKVLREEYDEVVKEYGEEATFLQHLNNQRDMILDDGIEDLSDARYLYELMVVIDAIS